jgi:hypothetical protein
MIPDFVFSTIPSGSTRLTVASLYSLPLTVLKSSAKAAGVKHSIKNVRTLLLISWLNSKLRVFLRIFLTPKSRRIAGRRNVSAQWRCR